MAFKDIDEYFKVLPEDTQKILQNLRKIIKDSKYPTKNGCGKLGGGGDETYDVWVQSLGHQNLTDNPHQYSAVHQQMGLDCPADKIFKKPAIKRITKKITICPAFI